MVETKEDKPTRCPKCGGMSYECTCRGAAERKERNNMNAYKPWVTDTMAAGPTGKVRVLVEEKNPMVGTTAHNRLALRLTKRGDDETMMARIGRAVARLRPSWVGWAFVLSEPA
jgi:hypothetical protein